MARTGGLRIDGARDGVRRLRADGVVKLDGDRARGRARRCPEGCRDRGDHTRRRWRQGEACAGGARRRSARRPCHSWHPWAPRTRLGSSVWRILLARGGYRQLQQREEAGQDTKDRGGGLWLSKCMMEVVARPRHDHAPTKEQGAMDQRVQQRGPESC